MNDFVKNISSIEMELSLNTFSFYLFMVSEREDITGKWDVVVSFELNGQPEKLMHDKFIQGVKQKLSQEMFLMISRFVFLPFNHPLVINLTRALNISSGNCELNSSNVNGVFFKHAHIFTAQSSINKFMRGKSKKRRTK